MSHELRVEEVGFAPAVISNARFPVERAWAVYRGDEPLPIRVVETIGGVYVTDEALTPLKGIPGFDSTPLEAAAAALSWRQAQQQAQRRQDLGAEAAGRARQAVGDVELVPEARVTQVKIEFAIATNDTQKAAEVAEPVRVLIESKMDELGLKFVRDHRGVRVRVEIEQ